VLVVRVSCDVSVVFLPCEDVSSCRMSSRFRLVHFQYILDLRLYPIV
jgi:hypothetical protein